MLSLLGSAALVAGCSGGGPASVAATAARATAPVESASAPSESAPSGSGTPQPGPGGMVALAHAPALRTVVLADDAPGGLSLAVSRALFQTAAVVAVAPSGDAAAVAGASRASAALGVPLLLDDGGPGSAGQLQAELRRLHTRTVVAAPAAAARLRLVTDATVLTDPGVVPVVSRPTRLGFLAVLVRADGDARSRAGATASTATAHAAGAWAVGVHGGDPRADAAAIAALARLHPRQVIAAGTGFGAASTVTSRVAAAATGVQLPGGGQRLFPGRRFVALYGHPGTAALGVLGEQGVDAAIARARSVAAPYRPLSSVPVVPAFEVIATVASGAPGPDGNYSAESSVGDLRPWVDKATAAGMYVVLDLQPGRTNFLTQAKLYESLLSRPNVGLALDPEWRLGPDQVHLRQIGSVSSAEINAVSAWLAQLTAAHHLPQKLLVIHQFSTSMIRDESKLVVDHDEVAMLIHMDGQGAQGAKDGTWGAVKAAAPDGAVFGWKNFYDEDKPILSPAGTMAKRPQPVMISYQ